MIGMLLSAALSFFVGTYGDDIYKVEFGRDGFEQTLSIPADNASYLAFDGKGNLFGVSENDPNSGVFSFGKGGMVGFSGSGSNGPCYLLCPEGLPFIFTADYGAGSITVFRKDGSAAREIVQTVQYPEGSHIHQVMMIPGTSKMLATDLGLCCIHVLDVSDAERPLADRPELEIPCAGGPRHIVFDGDRRFYCITEKSGDIAAFDIASGGNGELAFSEFFRVKADEVDAHGSADIRIRGNKLYASHRLDNDGISIWKIRRNGTLKKKGYLHTGKHPRCFVICGRNLFVACRDDNSIEMYRLGMNGLPGKKKAEIKFDSRPVCLLPL